MQWLLLAAARGHRKNRRKKRASVRAVTQLLRQSEGGWIAKARGPAGDDPLGSSRGAHNYPSPNAALTRRPKPPQTYALNLASQDEGLPALHRAQRSPHRDHAEEGEEDSDSDADSDVGDLAVTPNAFELVSRDDVSHC